MKKLLVSLFLVANLVPTKLVAGESSDWNFSLDVGRNFPTEMRYVALKRLMADLLQPCRRVDTSGSWDKELLETFERGRRQFAGTILGHLVDDELIPARGHSVERKYRRRVVVIDPFVFGRSRLRSDAVPKGYTLEVTLEDDVLIALLSRRSSRHGRGAQYSVAIWLWNSDERNKSCGFSYHR